MFASGNLNSKELLFFHTALLRDHFFTPFIRFLSAQRSFRKSAIGFLFRFCLSVFTVVQVDLFRIAPIFVFMQKFDPYIPPLLRCHERVNARK